MSSKTKLGLKPRVLWLLIFCAYNHLLIEPPSKLFILNHFLSRQLDKGTLSQGFELKLYTLLFTHASN